MNVTINSQPVLNDAHTITQGLVQMPNELFYHTYIGVYIPCL